MNDFTKEELEALTISVHHILMLQPQRKEFYVELQEKITANIERYGKPCEHKNCRRVSLLDGHDYDICPNCEFIRMVR